MAWWPATLTKPKIWNKKERKTFSITLLLGFYNTNFIILGFVVNFVMFSVLLVWCSGLLPTLPTHRLYIYHVLYYPGLPTFLLEAMFFVKILVLSFISALKEREKKLQWNIFSASKKQSYICVKLCTDPSITICALNKDIYTFQLEQVLKKRFKNTP